jgi:ABC-2 type transport system ATP-binding protein
MGGIEAINLVKDFGPFRAVSDVSFHARQGEVVGFLGPNGAGKSTTMKMLTGFLTPSAGLARIGGCDVSTDPIGAKKQLGYLPERGPLYAEMTSEEFLYFAGRARELSGRALRDAVERVISLCRIAEIRHRLLSTLSKGYRQRVGLAQALIHDPRCLILDEPTDGLDPNQKDVVRDLIRSMRHEKVIILSTHILEEVDALCSRVILINRGKILLDETPEQMLRRNPRWGALRIELAAAQLDQAQKTFAADPKILSQNREGDSLLLIPPLGETVDQHVIAVAAQHGWKIQTITHATVRLEDVFRDLTMPKTNS